MSRVWHVFLVSVLLMGTSATSFADTITNTYEGKIEKEASFIAFIKEKIDSLRSIFQDPVTQKRKTSATGIDPDPPNDPDDHPPSPTSFEVINPDPPGDPDGTEPDSPNDPKPPPF